MGHINCRDADRFLDVLDPELHLFTHLLVERGQEAHPAAKSRARSQYPGQRHPLFLATGKLTLVPIFKAGHTDLGQCGINLLLNVLRVAT